MTRRNPGMNRMDICSRSLLPTIVHTAWSRLCSAGPTASSRGTNAPRPGLAAGVGKFGLAALFVVSPGCFHEADPVGARCSDTDPCDESSGASSSTEADDGGASGDDDSARDSTDGGSGTSAVADAGDADTRGEDTEDTEDAGDAEDTAGSSTAADSEDDGSSDGVEGDPYGDPALGCRADEEVVWINGIPGELCSADCDTTADCPTPVAPASAVPQCALGLNGSPVPTNCLLACDFTAEPSDCPPGATCKDVGQGGVIGTCTYP